MKRKHVTLSVEDQIDAIANEFSAGDIFLAAKVTGSTLRSLLRGIALTFARVDSYISIFREQIVPDRTTYFIDEWERVVGIPDDCFPRLTGTDQATLAERRRNVTTKLGVLGIQTPADFVALAKRFGVLVTVNGGIANPDPVAAYGSLKAARFTIEVTPTVVQGQEFTYTFNEGAGSDAILFGNEVLALVECIFNKYKPANCQVVFLPFVP